MAVKFDVAFIPQLQAIAKDPVATTAKFTKIEKTHELQFNVKDALLVAGVALAVLAMTVLKQTQFTTGVLLLGAVCVIKAVLPKQVHTPEYAARLQEISALFSPATRGLTEAYQVKKTALVGVVTGVEAEDLSAASQKVQAAAEAFDKGSEFNGKHIENPMETGQEGSYRQILEAAQPIAHLKLDEFAKLDPAVMIVMRELQAAARQFLIGDRKVLAHSPSMTPGRDAYVRYKVVEGKIAIV